MKNIEEKSPELDEVKELKRRCMEAGIECKDDIESLGQLTFRVYLPDCRDEHGIWLISHSDVKGILSIPFENYRCLGDYSAIGSFKDGFIEATLRSLDGRSARWIYMILAGHDPEEETDENRLTKELIPPQSYPDLRISIGKPSREMVLLTNRRPGGRVVPPTLKIRGLSISKHDDALGLLETLANSVCFQIDSQLNLPLGLLKTQEPLAHPYHQGPVGVPLHVPDDVYDKQPMELYWYARSASGMPLLQFLAFYQCIEFYLPIYSRAEACRRVRDLLTAPDFQVDRDESVEQILSSRALLGKKKWGGYGEEKDQLKCTISACLDPNALRKFLTDDEKRKKHFGGKTAIKAHGIPLKIENKDLRDDVATRIYDIRCSIVHTKSAENEKESYVILPFSPEAWLLHHEIDLIHYVARKVLISASSALDI